MLVKASVETATGHRLLGYEGKCSHPHGHNYLWTAMLDVMQLDDIGMAVDFSKLKSILKRVVEPLDHAFVLHVDDPLVGVLRLAKNRMVVIDRNPTAEHLALWVRAQLRKEFNYGVLRIRVQETLLCEVETGGVEYGAEEVVKTKEQQS